MKFIKHICNINIVKGTILENYVETMAINQEENLGLSILFVVLHVYNLVYVKLVTNIATHTHSTILMNFVIKKFEKKK